MGFDKKRKMDEKPLDWKWMRKAREDSWHRLWSSRGADGRRWVRNSTCSSGRWKPFCEAKLHNKLWKEGLVLGDSVWWKVKSKVCISTCHQCWDQISVLRTNSFIYVSTAFFKWPFPPKKTTQKWTDYSHAFNISKHIKCAQMFFFTQK